MSVLNNCTCIELMLRNKCKKKRDILKKEKKEKNKKRMKKRSKKKEKEKEKEKRTGEWHGLVAFISACHSKGQWLKFRSGNFCGFYSLSL